MLKSLASAVLIALTLFSSSAHAGARLDAIKQKGTLTCGVGADVAGFSRVDAKGVWSGFDVDICRAVAAAIFGDATKVTFKPIDTLDRFFQSPDIDVVLRGLTWTFNRETRAELRFGPIILYDGQTFLVPKKLNVQTPDQLSGKNICVSSDAEFGPQLQMYFRAKNLMLKAVVKEKREQAEDAFFAGQCDAMAADSSELAEAVIAKAAHPEDYTILPQLLTKEPLSPLLRKDDAELFDVVRWAVFALIDAEELGVNSANVDRMRNDANIEVRRFFSAPPQVATGIARDWTYRIVKSVGNYGEIYERHLGQGSRAKLARGMNKLWTDGGLMYAPPVR
jgi:general L-amino acid transport system substrate-binding protein